MSKQAWINPPQQQSSSRTGFSFGNWSPFKKKTAAIVPEEIPTRAMPVPPEHGFQSAGLPMQPSSPRWGMQQDQGFGPAPNQILNMHSPMNAGPWAGATQQVATGWQPRPAPQGHPPVKREPGTPSVLVVGAGLSGSMVAHKLRKLHPGLYIAVWECARGAGGRSASRRYENPTSGSEDTCDLGAQVLTVLAGDDLAQQEMEQLCQAGICRPAGGIADTEERHGLGKREPYHYQSAGSKVMRWYLENAHVDDLRFNRRVVRVDKAPGGTKWQITSVEGNVSDPCGQQTSHATANEEFDSVVVCGDAHDALAIAQSGHTVTQAVQQYFESVQYDTRLCFGFVFSQQLNGYFEQLFQRGMQAEVVVNNDVIHMVASMAAKGMSQSRIGAITVHCTRNFTQALMNHNPGDIRKEGMSHVLSALASVLGCSAADLQSGLEHCDGVHWRRCQVTNCGQPPAQQDPAFSRFPGCAVASHWPSFVICGDYITGTPCFTGVVKTTTAGAAATVDALGGRGTKILVVGAGPVGSMAAAKIRQKVPNARITVWECAKGAAGRTAVARFGDAVADMGTQVLTANMADEVCVAEIAHLSEEGLITRANGLADSEERPNHGSSTCHYWVEEGTTEVQRHYLSLAKADVVRFNRRVSGIQRSDARPGWNVSAVDGEVSDPHAKHTVASSASEHFEAVVFAIPAFDVLQIDGLASVMDGSTRQALSAVTYDTRWSFGIAFQPQFEQSIEGYFRGNAERLVDDGVLHLVANQSAKRDQTPVLVCHTTRQYTQDNENAAMQDVLTSLSRTLGVDPNSLRSAITNMKTIHWKQCQLTNGAVSCSKAFSAKPGCAMLASGPPLFLAGDYLTGAGFAGAVTAATSVATAIQSIVAPMPIPRSVDKPDEKSVLIIGTGLTGSVLAEKLREKQPQLKITIWEAAAGSGGRQATKKFSLPGENPTLDMGAQVLSGVMEDETFRTEMDKLVAKGICHRAHGLCATNEERSQDKHVVHFWARDGVTTVQREYLKGAKADEMMFNRRVTSIDKSPHCGRWRVGYEEGRVSDPHATHKVSNRGEDLFHGVIVCTNAWDARHIDGVTTMMTPELKKAVEEVEYDSRFAVGLTFIPKFKKHIEAIFKQEAEMMPQDNVIHLVAYQGNKREATYPSVVVHTTHSYAAEHFSGSMKKEPEDFEGETIHRILQNLGRLWQVDPNELLQGLVASKTIPWHQCQVKKPIPSFVSETTGCAVVNAHPPLMLCGDYFLSAGTMNAMRAGQSGASTISRLINEPINDDHAGPSVLVLGAGLFGCASAAKIREAHPDAKITVWDASKGTGGKVTRHVFTSVTGTPAIADMGTQNINCNMSDPVASAEVEKLTKKGILQRAHGLSNTEERASRTASNDVQPYFASKGLTAVCHHYLKEAQLDEFCANKRATSVTPLGHNRWQVHADVGEVGDPYAPHEVTSSVQESFDIVVTALPSYELIKLGGLQTFVPPQLQSAISNLQYDRRFAVGLCFQPSFKQEVERWMGQRAELTVDDGVIHLVANQGAKRSEDSCVLVCHTACQFHANTSSSEYRNEVLVAVLNSLANQMQLPVAKLQGLLHASKVIDWRQCQCKDTIPGFQGAALVSAKPKLIMTGDYFATGEGAVTQMAQAANAVAQAFMQDINSGIPRGPGFTSAGPRVLVVGAGPNGCMLAAQLRRRYPDVRISVWECARGIGGRQATFRAELGNGKPVVLDMGAQVFSCFMTPDVQGEMEYLHSQRLVSRAQGLGISEERGPNGGVENNMTHWWAKDGTSAVYKKYLEEADVEELCFNTRVLGIEPSGKGWMVSGSRGNVSDPHAPQHARGSKKDAFDAVVLAMPAHDVMRIGGVGEVFSGDVRDSIASVQHDQRWSIGVVLSSWMKPALDTLFSGSSELVLDNNMIHLIAYQNAKREQAYPAVVIHTTRQFAANRQHTKESVWNEVKQQLGKMLSVDTNALELAIVGCKIVNWWECQTVHFPQFRSAVAWPPLILAGDYLTKANFSGCVEAASMGAEAVGNTLGLQSNQPSGWVPIPGSAAARRNVSHSTFQNQMVPSGMQQNAQNAFAGFQPQQQALGKILNAYDNQLPGFGGQSPRNNQFMGAQMPMSAPHISQQQTPMWQQQYEQPNSSPQLSANQAMPTAQFGSMQPGQDTQQQQMAMGNPQMGFQNSLINMMQAPQTGFQNGVINKMEMQSPSGTGKQRRSRRQLGVQQPMQVGFANQQF